MRTISYNESTHHEKNISQHIIKQNYYGCGISIASDLEQYDVRPRRGDGEIVNDLKREEQIFILHRPTAKHHQHELDRPPMTQRQALPASSMRFPEGETAPGWWFHDFEPVWRPFIQSLFRQKQVTLLEFERVAAQVPGLTRMEKTIAVSAFRRQQEQGLPPSLSTTAFHSERHLSAV